MELTAKQLATLTMIRRYRHEHGISPTLQELADMRHVRKVSVYNCLTALRKKGAIKWKANRARSLRIVGEDTAAEALASTVKESVDVLRQLGFASLADKLERNAACVRPAMRHCDAVLIARTN